MGGGEAAAMAVGAEEASTTEWAPQTAGAALEMQPVGGGKALTKLSADTTYELHYAAEYDYVDSFALFVSAATAAQSIASATAPTSGPWSGAGHFAFADWSPAPVGPDASGLYEFAGIAGDMPGGIPAGATGHIVTFTTGAAGTLRLDTVLMYVDETAGVWVEMPAAATFTVQ